MSFSPADAAFEGFRVARRKPMAMIWWTLLFAILGLASLWAMSQAAGGFEEFAAQAEALEQATAGGAQPTPEQVGAVMSAWGAAMGNVFWLVPLNLVIGVVISAAIARAVVRPSESAFGYLRLGGDEGRVFLVTLVLSIVLSLIAMGVMIAVIAGAGILGGINEGLGALVGVIGGLAALAFIIWLAVRWSLAVPITVAEKRIALFDSFRMTRGKFWPLLGMAALTIVMCLVVALLSGAILMPLSIAGSGEMLQAASGDDPAAMFKAMGQMNPWMIASTVVGAFFNALIYGVAYAPFAAAYVGLKGGSGEASD